MGLGGRYLIRLWAVPVLLAGLALAFDAADRKVPFSILATGALDEPATWPPERWACSPCPASSTRRAVSMWRA